METFEEFKTLATLSIKNNFIVDDPDEGHKLKHVVLRIKLIVIQVFLHTCITSPLIIARNEMNENILQSSSFPKATKRPTFKEQSATRL